MTRAPRPVCRKCSKPFEDGFEHPVVGLVCAHCVKRRFLGPPPDDWRGIVLINESRPRTFDILTVPNDDAEL